MVDTAIEVVNYLSAHEARGIALTTTDGMARGMAAKIRIYRCRCRWARVAGSGIQRVWRAN
jgi:F0F1-type ATP synthase beta subunit